VRLFVVRWWCAQVTGQYCGGPIDHSSNGDLKA
jgi:hypothetical protein